MKIIDIDTGEVIKEYEKLPDFKYFTTRQYWAEYEAMIREYQKEQDNFYHEIFFKQLGFSPKSEKGEDIIEQCL